MASQLLTDCLNEIIEHLEEDKINLHSCLLVNRHWCKISVRILWRNIWNINVQQSSILSTLIACLPNESKELLRENKIFISTPTSKPPLFNYAVFCKVLSICEIRKIIGNVLKDEPSIKHSLSLKDRKCLVANEVVKMFLNQITSLKKLSYLFNFKNMDTTSFTNFSRMKHLSELRCSSNLPTDFFCQLSQIFHNLRSISIRFDGDHVSKGLKELIPLQNNLKNLTLTARDEGSWTNIIPALTKRSNTVTKLHLYYDSYKNVIHSYNLPVSFVSLFLNLQEIIFSFTYQHSLDFI